MKTFKFKYRDANGHFVFKEVTLPDDAIQLVGYDLDNAEVYEGEELVAYDDGHKAYAALNAFIYEFMETNPRRPQRLRQFRYYLKEGAK